MKLLIAALLSSSLMEIPEPVTTEEWYCEHLAYASYNCIGLLGEGDYCDHDDFRYFAMETAIGDFAWSDNATLKAINLARERFERGERQSPLYFLEVYDQCLIEIRWESS